MSEALRELRIGHLRMEFPAVQAALSGYSDMPMRLIARRLGAPYTLCEVMLDKFILALKARQIDIGCVSTEEHPTGGQLMGADPQDFAPAALRLVEHGFDVIDINFGCPVKKVLGRCRGGFHLSQPTVALEIVRRVRDAPPGEIPLRLRNLAAASMIPMKAAKSFLKSSTGRFNLASWQSRFMVAPSLSATRDRLAGSSFAR